MFTIIYCLANINFCTDEICSARFSFVKLFFQNELNQMQQILSGSLLLFIFLVKQRQNKKKKGTDQHQMLQRPKSQFHSIACNQINEICLWGNWKIEHQNRIILPNWMKGEPSNIESSKEILNEERLGWCKTMTMQYTNAKFFYFRFVNSNWDNLFDPIHGTDNGHRVWWFA